MRILFQGGWKPRRDPSDVRPRVERYCEDFAVALAESRHSVILSSLGPFDSLMADRIVAACEEAQRDPKDAILHLLPQRLNQIPQTGRVEVFQGSKWWLEERTYLVQRADAVVAIGGGKGTSDCIQKALLAAKPVFVASAVSPHAVRIWQQRPPGYHYIAEGDADFVSDMNCGPEEFADSLVSILDQLDVSRYPRRVFIVHGHGHYERDKLAEILRRLDFEPLVLDRQASHSLTVIEKLERYVADVGFAFVLYTADDLGRARKGTERLRARQNVVFEHGMLVGKMQRDRTCALVFENVELPSDLSGVVYEKFSSLDREALRVARILKDAGYSVEADRLV